MFAKTPTPFFDFPKIAWFIPSTQVQVGLVQERRVLVVLCEFALDNDREMRRGNARSSFQLSNFLLHGIQHFLRDGFALFRAQVGIQTSGERGSVQLLVVELFQVPRALDDARMRRNCRTLV